MTTIEFTFNSALGDALKRASARWQATQVTFYVEETQVLSDPGSAAKQPDLLICDPLSPPIVIETSFSDADADKDAQARLGEHAICATEPIRTAISVSVDDKFRRLDRDAIVKALLSGDEMSYAVYQRIPNSGSGNGNRRWPTSGFIKGTIYDLSRLLPAASLPKETIEAVADDVAQLIDRAATVLENALSVNQQREIAALIQQRTPLKGLRTTMVLWLNAMLTQQRLSQQGAKGIPGVDVASTRPIRASELAGTWRTILEDNWNSIFEPAVRVLELVARHDPAATSDALRIIASAVEVVEVNRLGLHINVGAELFPKLSDDRKQAAAFYTQPATAELLAGLTISRGDVSDLEWRSADLFRRFKLADLACGTGTLLRAGFRRIAALHEEAGGTLAEAAVLHQGAMESGLIGTDVSAIAAHLTSSSLAAVGYGEPYGDTQIGWVAVGGPDRTGALEYLNANDITDLFDIVSGRSTGTGDNGHAIGVQDHKIDWILMNPPYSKTRGGQKAFDIAGLTENERLACQKRWARLTNSHYTNRKAGMGASFIELAHKKLKLNGRIGFVLPLTAALGDVWTKTRQVIEQDFTDVIVVAVAAGKALNDDALSADTGMEEMLLVARLRTRSAENHNKAGTAAPALIRCATLYDAPTRMGEAGEIARAIISVAEAVDQPGTTLPIHIGNDEIGQIIALEVDGAGCPWSAVGVTHDSIATLAHELSRGRLRGLDDERYDVPVEMTTVGDLFDVGPTHHLIGHVKGKEPIGAFEFSALGKAAGQTGRDRALWSASSNTQTTILTQPTHRGAAPKGIGSDDERKDMRRKRSTLFYARNMRWTSQKLLAATTRQRVMGGSAWTSLSHSKPAVRAAFALWANSTLGLIAHWTQGQRTHAGRSRTQVGALKKIPCPKLDELNDDALEFVEGEISELQALTLRPANQAHADDNRKKIDAAVVRMLGWPDEALEVVSDLARLWCAEPSVHGDNKAAVKLLKEAGLLTEEG